MSEMDSIYAAAKDLALDHIQRDVDRGDTVEQAQSSYHGSGGPEYHVEITTRGRVHVSRVNGVDCDYYFSLRKLFIECKQRGTTKQLALL